MYNGIIQKLCNGCILQMVVFIYWSNRIINRDYKNMFILFCPFFSLSSLHQIQSRAQRSIKRSINAFGISELAGLQCVYGIIAVTKIAAFAYSQIYIFVTLETGVHYPIVQFFRKISIWRNLDWWLSIRQQFCRGS